MSWKGSDWIQANPSQNWKNPSHEKKTHEGTQIESKPIQSQAERLAQKELPKNPSQSKAKQKKIPLIKKTPWKDFERIQNNPKYNDPKNNNPERLTRK